jgi:hypothetical protein
MKALLAALLALAGTSAWAQPAPAPKAEAAEPKVERLVAADEQVRIEELRVRGLTQRVVVKLKGGGEYEVVPTPGGRDPSQGRLGSQGAAGQRVWHLLSF